MTGFSIRQFLFSICFCGALLTVSGQEMIHKQAICFISDTQEPLPSEKLVLKPYRNAEARDSLFTDILRIRPRALFMLGDLESRGSREKSWTPLDSFLGKTEKTATPVYVIPGNHEYMSSLSGGIKGFTSRFGTSGLEGYSIKIDSTAVIMLNTNFRKMGEESADKEVRWYLREIDSLENSSSIANIIVCVHQAPFSNSKIVGSSVDVEEKIVPAFENTVKAKLLISGHSHNLEYFEGKNHKHYLVAGGGGGIAQPLLSGAKAKYADLTDQSAKPLYFYIILENTNGRMKIIARGLDHDFHFFELAIGEI